MSTQCKIHCYNCDNDYYVYSRGLRRDNIMDCPHCDAKMDDTMRGMIVDAILSVDEANRHFIKYHEERHEDLFGISIENINVPIEKFRDL